MKSSLRAWRRFSPVTDRELCLLLISKISKKSSQPISGLFTAPSSSGCERLISTLATRSFSVQNNSFIWFVSLRIALVIYLFIHVFLGFFFWIRCFNFGWVSWRMWRSRRKCGRCNTNLQLRRYMLRALTLVGFFLRYLKDSLCLKWVFGFVLFSWNCGVILV